MQHIPHIVFKQQQLHFSILQDAKEICRLTLMHILSVHSDIIHEHEIFVLMLSDLQYVAYHHMLWFIFTQDGTTPLLKAAEKGHVQVVKILIAAGATVDLAKNVSLVYM